MNAAAAAVPARAESKLLTLLREALPIVAEIQKLEARRDGKATIAEYIRLSVENAEAYAKANNLPPPTAARLAELRERLAGDLTKIGTREPLAALRAALRRIVNQVCDPNYRTPPRQLNRFRNLFYETSRGANDQRAGSDVAHAELMALGFSEFDLYCVAVQYAAQQHPQEFGPGEPGTDNSARLLQLSAAREALFARMDQALAMGDLDFPGPTIRFTEGKVDVGPRDTMPARLCAWAIADGVVA